MVLTSYFFFRFVVRYRPHIGETMAKAVPLASIVPPPRLEQTHNGGAASYQWVIHLMSKWNSQVTYIFDKIAGVDARNDYLNRKPAPRGQSFDGPDKRGFALGRADSTFSPGGLKKMTATEIARRYHDTWNGRDAEALVGCFTTDGRFCNPDTTPGISGEAIAEFVKGVWTALPDFSIELLEAGEIQPDVVAHHWLIRGTLAVPGAVGSESTKRVLAFKGASIIHVKGDKILSDENYFDRKALE